MLKLFIYFCRSDVRINTYFRTNNFRLERWKRWGDYDVFRLKLTFFPPSFKFIYINYYRYFDWK